jgi:Na+-driven multidrug efflux pump
MVKNILVLALPSILSVFLEVVMEVINTLFIGRLGDATMLAALGLAHIIFNLLSIQPMLGANSALETFVA